MIGSSNKNRVRRERHPHNVRLLNKLSRHTGSEHSIICRHNILMEETKLELTQHPLNPTSHPASSTVNTSSILHGHISRPRDASKATIAHSRLSTVDASIARSPADRYHYCRHVAFNASNAETCIYLWITGNKAIRYM